MEYGNHIAVDVSCVPSTDTQTLTVSSSRNDVQEVVPLLVEDQTPAISEPMTSVRTTDATIRLNIQGISVEIANNATQEVIQNTLAALQFIC
ncbi:MAG: hypothetical protein ACERKZ_19095 [Lachnotalea sp.]